jgi:hypothetical protein
MFFYMKLLTAFGCACILTVLLLVAVTGTYCDVSVQVVFLSFLGDLASMKLNILRSHSLLVSATFFLILCASVSHAQVYTSGPANGTENAFTIADGIAVSDSFTLTSTATFNTVVITDWTDPGSSTNAISFDILSKAFSGTSYGAGNGANVTSVFKAVNGSGADVNTVGFGTGAITLAAGTYYLELSKATTNVAGDYSYWDENDGAGAGYQYSAADGKTTLPGAETFSLYDLIAPVPESPTSVSLLLGVIGLMFCIPFMRRLRTACPAE